MFDVVLDEKYRREEIGTSDGTQRKYYKDEFWYKTNSVGSEGEVEALVSGLLKFSDLKPREFVCYESGIVNGMKGCRSKNFLKNNESFFTFNHIHKNLTGLPMHMKTNQMVTLKEQVEYVVGFIKDATNIDIRDYLKKVFTLDFLILNEDRHFNNLGIIMDENGRYRVAPIFDNGKSLFNGNFRVKKELAMEENVKRVICRPFGGTHKKLLDYFGCGFEMDYDNAFLWLQSMEQSLEVTVLKYQLDELKKRIS